MQVELEPDSSMSDNVSLLDQLIGREVVIDLVSQYVHLGKLVGWDHKYLVLEQADVHDLRDTSTTRELYVLESRRFGIRSNRDVVFVKLTEVVSISALEDVLP